MFRQSKLSIYFEFVGEVAGGGWLEGPEKTIDLGKKRPRGLAKRDHQNGSTVTVFLTPFLAKNRRAALAKPEILGRPG